MASPPTTATGFVLAGGHSTHTDPDKVFLAWNGNTFLEEALRKLREVCGAVYICTRWPELGEYADVVPDVVPDATESVGPLGGIIAALEATSTDWNLFLAVDLPQMPTEFLSELLGRATHGSALAVVPYLAGRSKPLCAAYHRKLLPGLRRALGEGEHAVMPAVERAASLPCETCPDGTSIAIDRYPVDAPDAQGHVHAQADWFLHIDTPEELTQAQSKFAAVSMPSVIL